MYALTHYHQLITAGCYVTWKIHVMGQPLFSPYELACNVPELVVKCLEIDGVEVIAQPGCPIGHLVARLGRLPLDGPSAPVGSVITVLLLNESCASVEPRLTFYAHRAPPKDTP